jgi:general stress protein YciG
MVDKSRKDQNRETHGKQGFASMPKEKVQEIASKGGKSSHGGHNTQEHSTRTQAEDTGHGKQGFASMPKEKVQEIARKGGKSSHGSHQDEDHKGTKHK